MRELAVCLAIPGKILEIQEMDVLQAARVLPAKNTALLGHASGGKLSAEHAEHIVKPVDCA
jgi:hypothetical protein